MDHSLDNGEIKDAHITVDRVDDGEVASDRVLEILFFRMVLALEHIACDS
ncbi:hypothetical protein [Halostagnicola bangensis]